MKKKPVRPNGAVGRPARSKVARSSGPGTAARPTRAEKIPGESEQRFRTLFFRSPIGIALADAQSRFLDVNEAFCSMLGYTREELLRTSAIDITHTDDKPASEIRFEGVRSGTTRGYNVEKRFLRKDGRILWVNATTVPITFSDGNFAYAIGMVEDITARKRSEEDLQDSEEKYRTLVENATEGLIVIQDGMMKFCNRRTSEITGYSRQELFSMPFLEFIHPDDRAMVGEHYRRRLKGDVSISKYAFRSLHKDGSFKWVEVNAVLATWEGKPVTLNFLRDISERKQADEALEAERGIMRTLIDNLPDNVFIKDTRGGIILNNLAHRRFLGRQELDDVVGKSDRDFFPPALADRYVDDERRIVESGQPLINYEEPTVDREGRPHWYLTTKVPVRDSQGNITALVGINRDITERKRVEESLKESEAKLQAIFNTVGTGIIIIDRDTLIIIEANQTAMEMTGLPKKRIIGQICHSLVCPAQAGKCPVKDLGQSVDNSERKLIHADGHLKDILKTVYPITIKGKDCYVESFIDITERKRAEEQVRQSLREKDLLLREVYHRTKNNMNVIIALLSMRGESSRDVTVAQTFKDIEDRIQAMALVHQKLYESRDLSNIDIREFVSDLAALLMRSHRISADDLTLVLEMDKVPVSIDVAMPCGMILTELFSNMFKHAFPDRRKGEVRLGIARAAGGEIELSYADNGIGVPAGFDFRSQPTLGLRTIFMLAEHQLQGEARFEGGRGVACRIRFNDANIPARFKS